VTAATSTSIYVRRHRRDGRRAAEKGVDCPPPVDRGFGVVTTVAVPGLGPIGLYQPTHKSPLGALG